ncbi:DUF4332 domain-containing protein [Hyphomicrobium sp. 1Nfss2.1]|uniref:DUF4332 domain-containing protein n=1 Tax=Hyphomicrobium sp. 1Nfss2.1 TaxID=3413936 RepID=UPI003C7B26B3
MSFLYRIIYAAHANGTHHKLALDALSYLEDASAEQWRNVFLKHAKTYLDGSKAPDNVFKDFKNHVLHVRDDYWGGAPEKAVEWYAMLLEKLRAEAWEEAVYAAGVLSHYVTDPFHPFHTGQTEAENAIHRACEWSINRSYDALAALARERFATSGVTIPASAQWLQELICVGAETANRQYERLIAHYDIHRGIADPPSGLDDTARTLVAELIIEASKAFARILDRAFAESGATPPQVSLSAETFLATLQIPMKFVEKKLANAEDRAQVRAMYQELQATGRVEATLPEDDRAVRDLHAKEVIAPREAQQAAARAQRLATSAPAQPAASQKATRTTAATPAAAKTPEAAETRSAPRVFLKASDDVEAAPSIGTRSAQKLAEAGIFTVADLLAADPEASATTLRPLGISAATLRLWQQQARLVMDIPGLRGTHSQLLTGAGYLDATSVAAAEAGVVCAAVLRYAATSEGQRLLRQDGPPATDKIASWVASAVAARAAA